jgi:hypothetical protein
VANESDSRWIEIGFDGKSGTVIVQGMAATQNIKEKILLCCGNVEGVEHVQDLLGVIEAEASPQFYTVVRGDTLSNISKEFYGNANLYIYAFLRPTSPCCRILIKFIRVKCCVFRHNNFFKRGELV